MFNHLRSIFLNYSEKNPKNPDSLASETMSAAWAAGREERECRMEKKGSSLEAMEWKETSS